MRGRPCLPCVGSVAAVAVLDEGGRKGVFVPAPRGTPKHETETRKHENQTPNPGT